MDPRSLPVIVTTVWAAALPLAMMSFNSPEKPRRRAQQQSGQPGWLRQVPAAISLPTCHMPSGTGAPSAWIELRLLLHETQRLELKPLSVDAIVTISGPSPALSLAMMSSRVPPNRRVAPSSSRGG